MSDPVNTPLPWTQLPAANIGVVPAEERVLELGLYHVTGPYSLSAYVAAKNGPEAIDALAHGEKAPWRVLGVWPDQCQAEQIAKTAVLNKEWGHMLADLATPFGLAFQKA